MNATTRKIFIIGLPRTGTTSLCLEMLKLGYKVAHTAFTPETLEQAQVIADTPVFCDYAELDKQFPNSMFIYLERDMEKWRPSIRQLLRRMHPNLMRKDGGFHPIMKHTYKTVFGDYTLEQTQQDSFLTECYKKHRKEINDYFKFRQHDLLKINLSSSESYQKLIEFLHLDVPTGEFEVVNKGGKITYWNSIKHPLKVHSHTKGISN